MRFYLVRHAEAEDGEQMDPTRGLTSLGEKQIPIMAEFLQTQTRKIGAVLCSSDLKRGVDTGAGLAKELDVPLWQTPQVDPNVAPEKAWATIQKFARKLKNDKELLVISHGPTINALAAYLMDSAVGDKFHFSHGTITHWDTDDPNPETGYPEAGRGENVIAYLHWMATVKMMNRALTQDVKAKIDESLDETNRLLAQMGVEFDEAMRPHYYEETNVKRWILGGGGEAGNCDGCIDNSEVGWIEDDDVFAEGDIDVDGPPLHPHCLLGDTPVSPIGGVTHYFERRYTGEVVVLRGPGIPEISITPDHPVLTRRGWVPAGQLTLDDDLPQCLDPLATLAIVDPYNDHVITAIQQIPRALGMSSDVTPTRVPISAEAFHGDAGINCEVEVIGPTGFIVGRGPRAQRGQDMLFRSGQIARVPLPCNGVAHEILEAALLASYGVVGGGHPNGQLMRSEQRFPHKGGFASVALIEPEVVPACGDRAPGNSYAIRNGQDTLAAQVRFVKLSEISRRQFDGHVYNIGTGDGCYVANTIIVHNCDCTLEYSVRRRRVYLD